jgi:EmrB/QacA subfamily drug resistance transporter
VPRGQVEQECVQRLSLLGVERSEELVLEAARKRAEPAERALAVGGEPDEVAPPVLGIAPPLDELLLLELVEKADERSAVVAERVGDRSLCLRRTLVEQGEDRVVIRAQAGLLVFVERTLLRGEAEPLEQEEARGDELRRQAGVGLVICLHLDFHFPGIGYRGEAFLPRIVGYSNDWRNCLIPTFQLVSPRRRWSALALIVTAQFMVILDVAIVNVALPSIKSDLGFSQTGLQWVITAYALLFGGALLLGGRLADLLGRRRMFIAGLALFAASSLLCGLAWSSGSLIAFRGLQGLGGALLAPAALSLLMTTFAEGRERNLALGIYGAASGSGAAAGVLLGGILTSYLGWSWIFFLNVPVGAAAIALTPFLLRESRADFAHRHFDLAGAASVTGGLMLLVYALTRATSDGWSSPVTLGLIGGAAALVAAFVAIESRSRSPLLPLRIFRRRALSAANAAMAIVGAVAFSEFYILTLYLQSVLHYSAVQSGVAFSAFALTVVVASNVAQAVVGRAGVRATLSAGLALSTVSVALLARLPVTGHYFWDLFPAFVLGGAGMGLSFVPVTIASLAGVDRAEAGVASGLVNTSRQIGGAIGLAAVSTVAASATSSYAHGHTLALTSAAATVNGFQTSIDVLGGLLLVALFIAVVFLRPARETVEEAEATELREAA